MSTANVAGVEVDTRHWIGGRRAGSAGAFTDLSPIDEQPLAQVARGGPAEVDAAVQAAAGAFAGWSATPPPDRAAVLRSIADTITERAGDLARVETADNGALLRSHLRSVMPRAAQNFRFFADWLGRLDGPDLEINGHREQVSWAPSGVTAVITPWNAPLVRRAVAAGARPALGGAVNPDLGAPFGGARQSGIGREGGTWSFDFYGDVKNTVYAPEGWHRG
jgi:aminomuconate-semialdehyde/2-hydroxymuconate-6-semialdehyde dehydrogenase